jgi:hypothetical protein
MYVRVTGLSNEEARDAGHRDNLNILPARRGNRLGVDIEV